MNILFFILALSSPFDLPPLDLNSASAWELTALKGVGEATAESIIWYRENVSFFFTIEEILFVPGVGESLLEDIRSSVSVLVPESPIHERVIIEERSPDDTTLTVVFLDVGNGDAILLQTEEQTWLIDGGPPGEGEIRAPVVQRLVEAGIDTVSTVAFTHPHADHIGGCQDVLEVFNCTRLIDPGICHSSAIYEALLEYVFETECGYTVAEPDDRWNLGGGVEILVVSLERNAGSLNEASAVFLVTLKDFSLLLTGDIENESIMGMTMEQTPVSVMKVPHHGSLTSLFPPWIRKTSPQAAVFCCGRGNPFGHPDRRVVEAWENTGARILRTDRNGNIFLYTDGESMAFTLSMQL